MLDPSLSKLLDLPLCELNVWCTQYLIGNKFSHVTCTNYIALQNGLADALFSIISLLTHEYSYFLENYLAIIETYFYIIIT